MKIRNVLVSLTVTALTAGVSPMSHAATVTPLPKGVTSANGYGVVVNPTVKKQIDIWEDFQCPYCDRFEGLTSSYLKGAIKAKSVKVVYHMLSFIGPESVLAANAAGCAVDEGKYVEYHSALFGDQASKENSGHWTASTLIALGKKVGISSSAFASCVNSKKYGAWVAAVEKSAEAAKVSSTPTVFLNGKEIDRASGYSSAAAFKAIVEGKKAPVTTPTPATSNSGAWLDASKYITVSGEQGKAPTLGKPIGKAPTELAVKDIYVGTGATILPSSTLTVHYTLMAWSTGKVVESSWTSGQQATFPLSGVIQGWQQGLVGAKAGGRRLLVIPPSLGYGAQAAGPIAANETLIFVVDIYGVK